MNKTKFIITLLFAFVFCHVNAQKLTAFFNYGVFSADGEPYIETYLHIPQSNLKHIQLPNGYFVSEVQVTMLFKQNDIVVDANKYAIKGVEVPDTANNFVNLIDLQRKSIANGEYTLQFIIKDKNDTANILSANTQIIVNIPENQIASSTVCFIDEYKKTTEKTVLSKSGYDLTPYFSNFYPQGKNQLTYYSEVYCVDKFIKSGNRIVIYSNIESMETPDVSLKGYSRISKSNISPVIPIFNFINIENLPSGNYYLVIIIKDESGQEIISTKKFFQRSNPSLQFNSGSLSDIAIQSTFASKFTSVDTLRTMIKSFTPKASEYEYSFIKTVDNVTNIKALQEFVYLFWSGRNEYDPEKAFNDYALEVKKVNKSYGNAMRKGYDTDRGRVYLKYGPPNHIKENKLSSSTRPYEIWQYYRIGNQSNRRFVFSTEDVSLKDYNLIHSDVIGELYNPRWQYDLYLNAAARNLDSESFDEMWGAPLDKDFME